MLTGYGLIFIYYLEWCCDVFVMAIEYSNRNSSTAKSSLVFVSSIMECEVKLIIEEMIFVHALHLYNFNSISNVK